jgi:hypothetical protein
VTARRAAPIALVAVTVGLAALAACANVNARFDAGQRAFSTGAWQQCISELERFNEDADCARDSRCDPARIDIAECRLHLGAPTQAFFALEDVRKGEPPGSPLLPRIERLQRKAQNMFEASLTRAAGAGTLTVRFTSRVHDRLRFHHARFFLDLRPIPTDNQPYVAGTTVLPVPPTSVAAGTHELEVYTVFAGHGTGVYSYLAGYKFMARSSLKIAVAAGATIDVDVRADDGDDLSVPMSDSIRMHFDVRPPEAAPPP